MLATASAPKNSLLDRVGAREKVTGAAKFTADFALPNMAVGVLVGSTISKGRIKKIDLMRAKNAPGVVAILTHETAPKIAAFADEKKAKSLGLGLRIFHSDEIFFSDQPVALVVAERLEQARFAASLIQIEYKKHIFRTDFDLFKAKAEPTKNDWVKDSRRGQPEKWASARQKIEAEFSIPIEVHSPIEPHATLAFWPKNEAKKLIVFDKNHAVKEAVDLLASAFGIEKNEVDFRAENIGGAFGSGLRVWPHTFAAIMASKMIERPVRVVLTRSQMFTMAGYRPQTWQKIQLGADEKGQLLALRHEAIGNTSEHEEFAESIVGISKMLYAVPNLETDYKILPLNLSTPTWMRAPGETPGSFALETAMDELAFSLKIDPVEHRLRNFAEKNPENGLAWSSNFLKECLQKAAEKADWQHRKMEPRAVRDGDFLIGKGMALGAWSAWRGSATVRARLSADGKLLLQSATSDIGPGTATAMVRIAAEALGIPQAHVIFELGRGDFPSAPAQGGSMTVASVGAAVHDVCLEIKQKLAEIALFEPFSLFQGQIFDDLVFSDGLIFSKKTAGAKLLFGDLLRQKGLAEIDLLKKSKSGDEGKKFSFYTFAAHFAEVKVNVLTGETRVSKFTSAVDAGKIVSPKTAASQISGAAVMGIGMALTERLEIDQKMGRAIGCDFANYHVPTQADVPEIDVIFIDQPDPFLNAMGAKGLGEIGLIGAAAAIGNAIFNATGHRLRDLPFLPEKIFGAQD